MDPNLRGTAATAANGMTTSRQSARSVQFAQDVDLLRDLDRIAPIVAQPKRAILEFGVSRLHIERRCVLRCACVAIRIHTGEERTRGQACARLGRCAATSLRARCRWQALLVAEGARPLRYLQTQKR